ncbi:MAG TPA: VCBS repeat-containing protein [Acidobacteriaceae bacterium]|nr:VCBS repeat-containing protein [Acidobacteriaceae bacterium]
MPQTQRSNATTTLTSNSATLQLPGSLTLSTTVAPAKGAAGVPVGPVQFLNGTHSLGSVQLKAIPATQNFSAPAIQAQFGFEPYGLFALPAGVSKYSALGMLDWASTDDSESAYPELTIYTGQGSQFLQNTAVYQLTNSGITQDYYYGIPVYATGDFNHDGITDILIHGFNTSDTTNYGNEFYFLPGTATATFNPDNAVISSDQANITCNCDVPVTEAITVDDFNGDGYTDVAYTAQGTSFGGQTGVAVNAGAQAPGSFTTFIAAPVIVPRVEGETFSSTAIASGHFTSSGHTDIAVVGQSSASTNGYVALYLNQGPSNGTINFAAPVLFNVGPQPGSIATADFRANGMTDVVVTNLVPKTQSGSVEVLFGDGKGNLTISSTVPIAVELDSASVADFNNDGYPDILAVGSDGSLYLLLNDGTGHFLTSTTVVGAYQDSLSVIGDFNGDGLADIAELTYSSPEESGVRANDASDSIASVFLNSASAQASLVTTPQTLPAGMDTLTANFPGDSNFNASVSQGLPITVTQTLSTLTWLPPATIGYGIPLGATQLNASSSVPGAISYSPATGTVLPAGLDTLTATFIPTDAFDYTGATAQQTITVTQRASTLTWAQPATMEYGTPLSATQLNATSSVAGAITYAPAAGTVLSPGSTSVTATFVPTDAVDYTGAMATNTITVTAPTFTGISPASAKLGDADTTIAVNGQGLLRGAVVEWNGTALSTTWVSLNQLTAVVPASLLTTAGTGTITVVDPNNVSVAGSQTFTVIASSAAATATAQATVEAGQDASLTLTVNPYPAPITATLTLAFTPNPPNTVLDPAVLFPNNTTTDVIQIPANSTAAIPAIDFATGSTAGTITVTIQLTAGGVDITPTTLAPVAVAIPASAPVINSVTIDRNGNAITVTILGLSSTRDMSQATFHFTPASGASLKTTDLTVDLTTAFTGWYQSAASDTFGTTFQYTQPFTLNSDATDVGSVSVTLTNSQGASQPGTAQ